MNIYEQYGTPVSQEPKTFPLSEDSSITLLPMGSDKARRAFERLMEPYSPRLNAGGKLTEEESNKLNVRFFAETVVVGWEGLKDREGELIPHSADAAKALFSEVPRFFALIVKIATNEDSFETNKTEADSGN